METFLIFIAISASVTLGVQGCKKVINEIIAIIQTKKTLFTVNFAVFLAYALAMWAVFSYGVGLMNVYGIEYTNVGLKIFDIFTTGSLLSGGSNLIYDWLKSVGKNIKISVKSRTP